MSQGAKFLLLVGVLVAAQTLADAGAPVSDQDVRSYNLGLGRWVFTQQCMNCHSTGVLGAPRFRNPGDWSARLGQGLPSLIEHTIHGHGQMPPKGGFERLTEREVSAAVAYVVDQSRRIVIQSGFSSPVSPSGVTLAGAAKGKCDLIARVDQCSTEELQEALIIQMLWLLAGGEY